MVGDFEIVPLSKESKKERRVRYARSYAANEGIYEGNERLKLQAMKEEAKESKKERRVRYARS